MHRPAYENDNIRTWIQTHTLKNGKLDNTKALH